MYEASHGYQTLEDRFRSRRSAWDARAEVVLVRDDLYDTLSLSGL